MKIKCYVTILAISLLCSCKKETANIFNSSSYPISVGNWWQYQVDQSLMGGGYDTIMLNVVSMTIFSPYIKYTCIVVLNGTIIDTGYFQQSDTALSFTNNLPSPYYYFFPNFHINFPAQTGDKWLGAFAGDTIKVVSEAASDRLSDGQTFGPCYYLAEYYDLPDNYKNESMILTPKIGLINQSFNFNSDTAEVNGIAGVQVNQQIHLISYHIQ